MNEFFEENRKNIQRFLKKLIQTKSRHQDGTKKICKIIVKEVDKLDLYYDFFGDKKYTNMIITNFPEQKFCRKYKKELLLSAHVDTVPISKNWSFDPFSGEIVGNKIYGLGALDNKAGICASIYSLVLSNSNGVVAITADEELGDCYGKGATFLVKMGLRAKGAISCEPFTKKISIGSRGLLREKIKFIGRGGHTGFLARKIMDPILMASKFSIELNNLKYPKNPPFNSSGGKVTIISGGEVINITPEECEVVFDFRITPNISVDKVKKDLRKLVRKIAGKVGYTFETIVARNGFILKRNEKVIQVLKKAAEEVLKKEVPLGVANPHATDACIFNEVGIPCTAGFGVDGGNAHDANEWVSLKSLEDVIKIYSKAIDYFNKG